MSDWIAQTRANKGLPPIDRDPEPVMFQDALWIWNGFQMLSETRDYGMGGPLRVKLTEIEAYLRLRRIDDPDDIEVFLLSIFNLDGIWVNDYYERTEDQKAREKQKRERDAAMKKGGKR